jgi:hypothetical protein
MDELQIKGLFYNCDDKYFPMNKCKECKIFMDISKDVDEEDAKISPMALFFLLFH